MSWRNGRSLTAASSGSTGISFTYDAGGMRTSKTVGNVTSIYAYASGKLLREIRYNSAGQTTDVLDFFYAYDGTPYAMKYNGTVYYFLTNLQGDVMMILDASGSLAGGYVYDPYGKVLTASGAIAQINPIRYRGYYHDTETGFYYLHSRYYDPEIGRFINADSYASTGQGVIGHNMFAYCNNNPVKYIDSSGGFPWLAVGGAVVNVGVSYVAAAIEGKPYTLVNAGLDAVSGALGTSGTGTLRGIAIVIDVGYSVVDAYINGATSGELMMEAVTSAMLSAISSSDVLLGNNVDILDKNVDTIFNLVFDPVKDLAPSVIDRIIEPTPVPESKPTAGVTISPEERRKLTFKETQLDPPKKVSVITQAEYERYTFMERRLDK